MVDPTFSAAPASAGTTDMIDAPPANCASAPAPLHPSPETAARETPG